MQLETFGPGMPSESLPDRQATHQQVRRGKSSKIYTFKKVGVRHREDESFDLLGLSCLKTSCGVAEYRQVRFTWPGQRRILYPVLKLYYFHVPEE